jgi:hypothetical protein
MSRCVRCNSDNHTTLSHATTEIGTILGPVWGGFTIIAEFCLWGIVLDSSILHVPEMAFALIAGGTILVGLTTLTLRYAWMYLGREALQDSSFRTFSKVLGGLWIIWGFCFLIGLTMTPSAEHPLIGLIAGLMLGAPVWVPLIAVFGFVILLVLREYFPATLDPLFEKLSPKLLAKLKEKSQRRNVKT